MSDNKKQTNKEAMKALRQQRKQSIDRARSAIKAQNKDIKSIRDALKDGGKTVPEITAVTKMPSSKVMVYVATLKKYGMVAEGPKNGDYFKYELLDA
jgi:Fic family protein